MILRSYPSIYALGHAAVAEIFADPVVVQEKIDGSQFSFGLRDGVLFCRSKGADIHPDAPEKMFALAIQKARQLVEVNFLVEGWTYRAEYLRVPQHNTIQYGRVPRGHLVLFDADAGIDAYLTPEEVASVAVDLGLESVPTFCTGQVESFEQLMGLLDQESILGGTKIEGLVIKNYHRFGPDKHPLMAKYVRESFKEENRIRWKFTNPGPGDLIQTIAETYRTEARWRKAVEHLRDDSKLEGSPRDIALLIREVPADVLKECREEIEKALWVWAWPKIERAIRAGLAEWYKESLARSAFPNEADRG